MATINTRIKLKKDTATNWSQVASTFQPLNGELLIEGSRNFKIGDGTTYYNNLPYANSRPVLSTISSNTTLTASHCECFLPISGTRTITIPASFAPVGTEIELYNAGSGTVTIASASGVTIRGVSSTSVQYETLLLKQVSTNTWQITKGTVK